MDIRPEFAIVFSTAELNMLIKACLSGNTTQQALGKELSALREREVERWRKDLDASNESNLRTLRLKEELSKSDQDDDTGIATGGI